MFFSYDESIGILTNEVSRKIVHYLTTHLESHNVTPAQWIVLFRLSQQDRLSQTELAKRVNRDQPTLARILDILENKKLIERQASKEDRRSFIILLTAQGTSLVQELAPYVESIYQKMLRGISKEHLTIYSQTLNAIKNNILAD